MSCEKENKGTLSALNMYIEISIYVLIVCHVMCIQANAQYTERNNIKSIKIHRNDYFNPGSSGDVNPEISNRGIILINHFKPTDSWSTYEFNLSKYISIDTLDKLIEKVGTNENDETVCVHRITRDTIYCHDYASVYPWLLERVDTNQYLNCITKTFSKDWYLSLNIPENDVSTINLKSSSMYQYVPYTSSTIIYPLLCIEFV